MSHYEEQVEEFCVKCKTLVSYDKKQSTLSSYCKCGNLVKDSLGYITTFKERKQRGSVFVPEGEPEEVKSDGGSSSYYGLELMVAATCVKEVEGHPEVKKLKLETGDIIRALVDNDFDLGNIIKAVRRIHQARKGEGKQGTDVEYDLKKMQYFQTEWYKAFQMEQI